MCSPRSLLLSAMALVASSFTPLAYAQETSAEDKAAARELAVLGIQLAQDGKCDHAMDPLTRAEQLYHAPTILTWIGECQIQMGHLVAGSETLREVVREQLPDDAPSAFVDSQKRADQLLAETTPRIAKLTLAIRAQEGELEDQQALTVAVDGVTISLALIGVPRPTDPGKHDVVVELKGYESQKVHLVLAEGGAEQLNIVLKAKGPASSADNAAATEASTQEAEDAPSSASSVQKTVGWVLVGSGAAFLAGGGVLGYLALNKKQNLDCPTPNTCPPSQESLLHDARLLATLSTVSFGLGAAAAVTGLIVLLTDGDNSPATAHITTRKGMVLRPELGFASVGLSGSF